MSFNFIFVGEQQAMNPSITFRNDGTFFHFCIDSKTILSIETSAINHTQAEDIYVAIVQAMLHVVKK
ncbi:hypothetical protein ACWI58_001517 [Vibrio fluvialis]